MASKRRKKFILKTADQLRVISSPAAIEILQALRHTGPSSVRELGPILGRNANSLHYHVRRLLKNSMIRKTETRMSGARSEAVYDVVAEAYIGRESHHDEELRQLTNAGVASMLRLARRNWERAAENPDMIVEKKGTRNYRAHRFNARLDTKQLEKINGLIKEIDAVFRENIGNEDGGMCSLTILLTPIKTDSKVSK